MVAEISVSAHSGVAELRIDRPSKKNAITAGMYAAMDAALASFQADEDVRVAIIRGGPDFTAGNDLRDFVTASTSHDSSAFDAVMRFLERLSDFSKPIVAAVRGNAVGIGTTMLLHADVVVAGDSARFRAPFAALGLVPEAASSLLLPLTVGRMRAAWLLLAGDAVSAGDALAMGLVSKVAEDRDVDATASVIATQLAALPPVALRETKRLLRAPVADAIRHQMQAEASAFIQRLNSDEFRSAVANVLGR